MENVVERSVSSLMMPAMVDALNSMVVEVEKSVWQRHVVDVGQASIVRDIGVVLGAATVGRRWMHRERMYAESGEVVRAAYRHQGGNPRHRERSRLPVNLAVQ